jgi:hypothetical protein
VDQERAQRERPPAEPKQAARGHFGESFNKLPAQEGFIRETFQESKDFWKKCEQGEWDLGISQSSRGLRHEPAGMGDIPVNRRAQEQCQRLFAHLRLDIQAKSDELLQNLLGRPLVLPIACKDCLKEFTLFHGVGDNAIHTHTR